MNLDTRRGVFGLRMASAEDAQALGHVQVAAWREAYLGLLPDDLLASLSVETCADMWRHVLAEAATETCAYVFQQTGEIVAFGSCGAQRTPALAATFGGEFSAIYVRRVAQRLGLGTALMAIMASDLMTRGFPGASLWVLRDNRPARSFYGRLGGRVVAEKTETPTDHGFVEVAYGWPDLRTLVAEADAGPRL